MTILSPTFVQGPGDINGTSSGLVDAVRRRALPVCPIGGINPIDVRDLVQAFVMALKKNDPAPHYILASQKNLTLKQYIKLAASMANVKAPAFSLPNPPIIALAKLVESFNPKGDLTEAGVRLGQYYWYFDGTLARDDLSLKCRPLEQTLTDMLNWLDHGKSGQLDAHEMELI